MQINSNKKALNLVKLLDLLLFFAWLILFQKIIGKWFFHFNLIDSFYLLCLGFLGSCEKALYLYRNDKGLL